MCKLEYNALVPYYYVTGITYGLNFCTLSNINMKKLKSL